MPTHMAPRERKRRRVQVTRICPAIVARATTIANRANRFGGRWQQRQHDMIATKHERAGTQDTIDKSHHHRTAGLCPQG